MIQSLIVPSWRTSGVFGFHSVQSGIYARLTVNTSPLRLVTTRLGNPSLRVSTLLAVPRAARQVASLYCTPWMITIHWNEHTYACECTAISGNQDVLVVKASCSARVLK